MISTEQIKKRKSQLEDALRDVHVALNHEEYTTPFKFKRMDLIEPKHLRHHHLKNICEKCIVTGSGFDPSLITQHIEHIALDRFNKIVLDELSLLSIESLMGMRHELELLMLKERSNHYNIEIEKINKLLVEDTTGVVAGDLVVEESLKESNNKNSKKKK
jgi:hypothetical protein